MRKPTVALLFVPLFLLLNFAQAHSQHRDPLRYITTISNHTINSPSHRCHAHSHFDLTFSLHDGEQDVKLSLEPNTDIIASDGLIEYLNENGKVERREPLHQGVDKVYKGSAWLRDEYGWYWAGWARIVVIRDGVQPLIQGAFMLDQDAHHIQLYSRYLKTRHQHDPLLENGGDEVMVVFRDSDIHKNVSNRGISVRSVATDLMCPSDMLDFNVQLANPVNRMIMDGPMTYWNAFGLGTVFSYEHGRRFAGGLTKRQTIGSDIHGGVGNSAGVYLKDMIGKTDGCPRTRQIALIGAATDCTYSADFGDENDLRRNIIQQINSASALYEKTFNIALGLSRLQVSKATCPATPPDSAKWNVPCSGTLTIEDRLQLFSNWRGERADDGMALWILLTTCETGASVGLAWLGQLCQSQSAMTADGYSVNGVVVAARTPAEWKVIAHEIGHSMGAVHDCTSQTCSDGSEAASMCCPLSSSSCNAKGMYIMNPSTTLQMQQFSPCSIGNICSAFRMKRVDTSCLSSNKNVPTLTEKICGNGIVEEGEECDCGGSQGCADNKCCDGSTCKFKNNAVCDDSNEECCQNCQFAPSTKVCRPSNGECDPQETCTGNSPTCPVDVIAEDGKSCGKNGFQCASGQCTSRDQQCRSIMGQISSSNDTASCDESSCILTCRSPALGYNVCLRMQQNFLDGTPCQVDGSCQNGRCVGATAMAEVRSWIKNNRNIIIGVSVGLGVLLLLSIFSCCLSRYRRRNSRKKPDHQWQQVPSRGYGQDGLAIYPAPPPIPPPRRPSMAANGSYHHYHSEQQEQLPRYG